MRCHRLGVTRPRDALKIRSRAAVPKARAHGCAGLLALCAADPLVTQRLLCRRRFLLSLVQWIAA
jgi:hypothetical protein